MHFPDEDRKPRLPQTTQAMDTGGFMPKDQKDKNKRKYLHNVEVSHVSLVDHPANQRAFQIIKRHPDAQGETPMHVSLKNVPFRKKDVGVTSVIAKDEARGLAVASILMDGEVEVRHDADAGLYEIRKAGTVANDREELIRPHGEDFGIAYTVNTHITKALDLFGSDSNSFNEVLQKESFVPGLMQGLDALHTTIANIAMSEDTASADQFRTQVEDAVDAFKKYMSGLITSLPETAFKFEKAVVASAALAETRPLPGGFSQETYDAIFGDAAKATGLAPATEDKAAEASDEGASEAEGEVADGVDASAGTDADAQATADGDEGTPVGDDTLEAADASQAGADADPQPSDQIDFEKMMEAMTSNLGKIVNDALAPVNERLDGMATRLDKSEADVAKISKSMGSAIASEPDVDGDTKVVDLRKGAEGRVPPLLDTGYSRPQRQG